MINLNTRIADFSARVWDVVTLPDMCQGSGAWDLAAPEEEAKQCCFGARVAFALGTPVELSEERKESEMPGWYAFEDGQISMEEALGVKYNQLKFMLWAAGADFDPFGIDRWPETPSTVMKNLMKIEWCPSENVCESIRRNPAYMVRVGLMDILVKKDLDEEEQKEAIDEWREKWN